MRFRQTCHSMGSSIRPFHTHKGGSESSSDRSCPFYPVMMKKGRHLQYLPHHISSDQGDTSPEEPAQGMATRIAAKERMTQTPPLLSRLIQGYLDHTGIEACPYHQMDHGVRGPDCDHCKRALGPLYHHKIVGNRNLPIFTSTFLVHTPIE